jgi:hypothetical protein
MDRLMTESGLMVNLKARASKHGQTEGVMKVNGLRENQLVKEKRLTQTALSRKVYGKPAYSR